MSDDFELSEEERRRLERLKRDVAPPSRIEAALLEELKRRGMVRAPRNPRLAAIALAVALAAGIVAAVFVQRMVRDPDRGGPQYVMLLYAGDDGGAGGSRREEYGAWARSVAEQGTRISGYELVEPAEQMAVLPDNQGQAAAQPRGFFIINARDLDEARRIAETCPHLRYGGQIVLRRTVS
jgi:hypothetical protein